MEGIESLGKRRQALIKQKTTGGIEKLTTWSAKRSVPTSWVLEINKRIDIIKPARAIVGKTEKRAQK